MLNGANCEKYGKLKRSMAENYVMETIPPEGWNKHIKQDVGSPAEEGAMFIQSDEDTYETDLA
jgi:hypothetical protein